MMNKVYLSLGSNLGDREGNLADARDRISRDIGQILKESSVYETEAWGFDGNDFINQCILVGSDLASREIMNGILLIENDMGRLQERKQYENRVIDIDILFFNDEIIHVPGLVIPHREIENRRFVLEPLNEIGPGITHPVLKKGISSLLSECRDRCKVVKY